MTKDKLAVAVISAFLSFSTLINAASMDWQVDVMPGSILVNLDNAFKLESGGKASESMSLLSSFPNITVGATIEHSKGFIELRGGPGLLLNSRVRALALMGTLGASFELKPSVLLGPHVQVMQLSNIKWWGDGLVEFPNTPGFGFGMHLAMGDKISYLFSVDYLSMSFDADTGPGWEANYDKLDMSGLAVQFGIRANF